MNPCYATGDLGESTKQKRSVVAIEEKNSKYNITGAMSLIITLHYPHLPLGITSGRYSTVWTDYTVQHV